MKGLKQRLVKKIKGSLVVGVDIGSCYQHAVMRHPDGRESKIFKVENTVKGFDELWRIAQEHQKKWSLPEITFGMESTGNYSQTFGAFFEDCGALVVQVNGAHTKRFKEVMDNSPLKSDLKDPKVIGQLVSLGHVLSFVRVRGGYAELRNLNFMRERLMDERIRTINGLKSLLVSFFPEFESVAGDIKSKSAQYLILNGYHDPRLLQEADPEVLGEELKRVSRGRKGADTVKDLVSMSFNSIGLREGIESMSFEIRQLCESLAGSDEKIRMCEERMKKYLEEVPYAKHLLSIKGVGLITVCAIAGELGDFNRFTTLNEVEKYAGLNLYEVSSGRFHGSKRISKRGRSYLRKSLYLAALNMVRSNPDFKVLYQAKKNRGKNSFSALTALSRKLLRICFGLVKYCEDYDSEKSKRIRKIAA